MKRNLLLASVMPLLCGPDLWGPAKNKDEQIPLEPIHLRSQSPVMHCDNCMWLSPKEKHQSSRKEPHMCTKFKVQVYHHNQHPKIFRCHECLTNPEMRSNEKANCDQNK